MKHIKMILNLEWQILALVSLTYPRNKTIHIKQNWSVFINMDRYVLLQHYGGVYYFLDVDSVIWLVEMWHMMLKYQVLFP